MVIRTSFKKLLIYQRNQIHYEDSPIIQKKKLMYPFYYPFATPFCYAQFPPYSYDANNVNQFYNLSQQFVFEQKQKKCQEFNTNYSLNELKKEEREELKPVNNHLKQTDFLPTKKDVQKRLSNFDKKELYQPKEKKIQQINNDRTQRLRYVNKNFESNIINKIFSFLWCEDKSKPYVTKILKDKTKVILYYDYIKIIKKYCKRYINKEYLQNLCNYQPHHIAYRIVARHTDKLQYFTMGQLSKTIRRLIYLYLKDVCPLSILTSKKMRKDIWRDHFQKSRNIYEFLFQELSHDQYEQRMTKSYEQIYQDCKTSEG